jgi:hypothetical protein
MQHESSSNYPSERRDGSSNQRGESTAFSAITHNPLGRNPTLSDNSKGGKWYETAMWKHARNNRDWLLALRVSLCPTGPHKLFDDELNILGDDLREIRLYMAHTYGPNRDRTKE